MIVAGNQGRLGDFRVVLAEKLAGEDGILGGRQGIVLCDDSFLINAMLFQPLGHDLRFRNVG